ncbi:caspase-3 isoform X3 [Procambarus clarkii]|uniref:caspase-3 isoform X3 n=1 Tax=Procambarus clarkii TaxID=6728 RepID=UPI0037434FF5
MAARQQALREGVVRYDEASSSFQCVVCRTPLSGEASVDQHLDGSKHREAGVRYAIANIDNCPDSLRSILTPNCITAVKNGVICSTEGHAQRCTVCSVNLTGIRQIEDHLIGDDHRKKSEKQRLCGVSSPVVPLSVGVTVNPGQLPRQPEPQTIQALARVGASLIEEAMANGLVTETDNVSEPFLCNICNKKFNSSHTLSDHLKSNKHKKKESDNLQRQTSLPLASNVSPRLLFLNENSTTPGRDSYSLLSEPRGYVYVFNNKFLGQGSNWQRNGAEMDSQNIDTTFTRMGYRVIIHEDLTGGETEEAFNAIRRNPDLNGIDAFIVFILSHGKDAYKFYTNDQEEQSLFYVRSLFSNRKCPSLSGKPKIFFTNYCRGDALERQDVDAVRDVPKDMFTIHAASEGIMARRHQRRGTYFVFCLCDVLTRATHPLELQDLYSDLYDQMGREGATRPMNENHGFVKKFYFSRQ